MNPPVIISRNGVTCTLYCGDCIEIAPTLTGIDAVISDPPYGVSHKSSHGASWEGTQIEGDGCTTVRDAMWNHFAGHPRAMFGISWKQPPPTGVRAVIIWNKGPGFGAGDLKVPWKPSWEEIYIAGDGWSGRRDEGVLSGACAPSWETIPTDDGNGGVCGRLHPHQKPVWLMAHLINKLPDSKLILDPFLGSGTTAIACLRTGRNFIGIEKDPKYFATAVERIQREANQGVLI